MESISQLVWLYMKGRPFLKEVLREGIVNYSALARKISTDAFGSVRRQNAVKMALIRLSGRLRERESDLEGRILSIMGRSSMTIKSKVAVAISSRELEGIKPLSYARSGNSITYIISGGDLAKLSRTRAVGKSEANLNLITIESPEDVEEVPGVISYLLGALASEGVNVVEFISCYTDTLLVVRESDTQKAYRILSGMMG